MEPTIALNHKKHADRTISVLKSKKLLVFTLICILLVLNGFRIKSCSPDFRTGNSDAKIIILITIAVVALIGVLLIVLYFRISNSASTRFELAISLCGISYVALNLVFLGKSEYILVNHIMTWTEILLVICSLQILLQSIIFNILIFATIQIYGFASAIQQKPFDYDYPIHGSFSLIFLVIILSLRDELKTQFKPKAQDNGSEKDAFWKKIVNAYSDLVLIVKDSEELCYVNRPSSKSAHTLRSALDPYFRLENLRFKDENEELIRWIITSSSPDNSQMGLLKTSGLGHNQLITLEPESGSKIPSPRKKKDVINIRRSFYMIDEQSPPSAMHRRRTRTSLRINLSLEGIIGILLSDLKKLERVASQKGFTVTGKIANAAPADNLEADRETATYEIKFQASKFDDDLALIIIITETTSSSRIAQLEDLNKYKNNMLGSFSHVLRTPLNGILNFLTVAKDNSAIPSSTIQSIITPAITCSQQLLYLINDVLDYSQLSLKSLTLNFSLQEILPTIEEVIQLFETEARLKGISLKYDIAPNSPSFVRTDFTRLKQILINLLKTSLNHTFSGDITLSVCHKLDRLDDDSLGFSLKVSDINIRSESKNMLDKILNQNETNEAEIINMTNGTLGGNIGLIVSSRLARLLGQKDAVNGIIYKSDGAKCAEFLFDIEDKPEGIDILDIQLISEPETPKKDFFNFSRISNINPHNSHDHNQSENFEIDELGKEGNAEEVRTESPKRSSLHLDHRKATSLSRRLTKVREATSSIELNKPSSNKRKNSKRASQFLGRERLLKFCSCKSVLIVDDDAFNILSLSELLKSVGLEYEKAFNGDEAVQMIEKKQKCSENCRRYSLIFMDCNMPVRDGYETTQILKKKMLEDEINFIPIVACTAYIIDYQSSRCAEVGMDDYICKPVNKAILINILKRWEVIS